MDDDVKANEKRSTGSIYHNSAIAVIIAWSLRLIGLVSVLVLARVLTPNDFGIVALAMSTLAIADVFSALGLRQALIMCPEPDRSHYDTAWTIQLLVLAVLFVVLLLVGPHVARFYDEPALTLIIAVLATRFIFYGLANIAIIDFDRNFELGRDLRMRIIVRLLAFAVTLTAALVLRNYWALVIGAVAQSILHMCATYIFHPFRPRFSFARRAELLGVSLWMFIASASQTAHNEMEKLIVGRIGTTGVLGLYSVSKDLSHIFTQEIATALNRVTFVTTAQSGKPLSAGSDRLAATLGAYAMIAAPMGLGIAATAADAVDLLLGAQWTGAVSYLRFIAPGAAFFAVYKLTVSTLQAAGEPRQAAMLAVTSLVLIAIGAAIVITSGGGPLALAQSALVVAMIQVFTGSVLLSRKADTGLANLLWAIARPFLAASGMFLVISWIGSISALAVVNFGFHVALGSITYLCLLLAIWWMSNLPEGAEAKLINFLRSTVRF